MMLDIFANKKKKAVQFLQWRDYFLELLAGYQDEGPLLIIDRKALQNKVCSLTGLLQGAHDTLNAIFTSCDFYQLAWAQSNLHILYNLSGYDDGYASNYIGTLNNSLDYIFILL